MARGQPDFGMYAPKTTVAAIADMGELAARLGSPVIYDRRGDVVYFDSFENDILSWLASGSGTGYATALSSYRSRHGLFSMKLTTGSTALKNVLVYRYLPLPVLSSIGWEVSLAFNNTNLQIDTPMQIYTGSNYILFNMRYNTTEEKLYLYDSNGEYIDVGLTTPLYLYDYLFHTFKLVGDYANGEYSRILVDDFSVDVSDYAANITSSTASPRLYAGVRVTTTDSENRDAYLDSVILTQNEP